VDAINTDAIAPEGVSAKIEYYPPHFYATRAVDAQARWNEVNGGQRTCSVARVGKGFMRMQWVSAKRVAEALEFSASLRH